jgi:hypothetical protein
MTDVGFGTAVRVGAPSPVEVAEEVVLEAAMSLKERERTAEVRLARVRERDAEEAQLNGIVVEEEKEEWGDGLGT